MIDQGDLIISILKKWQDLKISSWETMKTELELFVESRSFVNRVNDQVRKRQKRISNVAENGKTFYYLVNVYGLNNGISGIHWKELPKQL